VSTALVTGARGQDGTYLRLLLEERGYEVVGVDRGDVELTDRDAVRALLRETRPRELYNLASATFVPQSWDDPVEAARVSGVAVAAILDAVAAVDPGIRVLQASSAEVFGVPETSPQDESTPRRPTSPYGAAKAFADDLVQVYRAQRGLHASSAILYNHESPLRAPSFLPAKVAHGAKAIAAGTQHELALGNLQARRDWGYAPDYVDAMWRMLQQDAPDDYVIATGEAHTVEELVDAAFRHVGLDWRGHVVVDESLVRPDAALLVGDASKARVRLGWAPTVTFDELVRLLVEEA
jgi:GDPmannose 4,6-dehydratase